ncbi:MAG: hypothetical protein ACI4VF_06705, partial [Lachnospirales bacterium]
VKEGHTFISLRELENADFKVDYNPDTKLLILNNKLNNLPVSVNGNIKEVSAINVEGNNYIKLRDLPNILDNVEIDYFDKNIVLTFRNE